MQIDFLRLKNFRGIESGEISFENKRFVALIGDNGSGKTTVLEAITKAFVPILRPLNSEAFKQCDLKYTDIRSGASAMSVTVGMTLEKESYIWSNRKRYSAQDAWQDIQEPEDISEDDKKRLKDIYKKYEQQGNLPLILYYGTDRIIREVPRRGHIKEFYVKDALRNCFDNVNYFRDFYDWFKTEEDIELREIRRNAAYKNVKLDSVRKAIETMIRGYSNLRIELNPARMLVTNEYGIDLQIDQLSGGYKAVLSVVADIAKRLAIANPNSPHPLEEKAVILIDELDLHLHPRWQKNIVEDLKQTFPNCQFIISTHSPFIIQSLRADELYDLSQMSYAQGNGSYNGWSIDAIQEQRMGVEPRTEIYHELSERFTNAMDEENYEEARNLYTKIKEMINPDSIENSAYDLDMEMIVADDKTD